MHVEHRARDPLALAHLAADQHGLDRALTVRVVPEVDAPLPVAGAEHVLGPGPELGAGRGPVGRLRCLVFSP